MKRNHIDINLSTDITKDNATGLNVKIMSRDINNNSFVIRFTNNGEPLVLDDSYTVEVLSSFTESEVDSLTQADVYTNYAKWSLDTSIITQDETVYNYVYIKKDGVTLTSADTNAFYFNVGLSKIDETANRTFKGYDYKYEQVLHEFEVAINMTKEEWAQMADETRSFVEDIKDATVDEFVELKMGEELANLETNYATRLTGLESNDANLTAQLAQKATKGEIALSDLNKNKVQFDGTWFNDEFLEDLSNGEINTTFLENGSVTSEKLANDSVNAQKTTFVVASKNLFDGKYLAWALTGNMDYHANVVLTEDREHARSAFVRLKKQTDYTISKEASNRFRVALIDKVPEHLDRVSFIRDDVHFEDSGTEFTFNSGDNSYVIILVSNNVNYIEEPFLQIEEGIVKNDWETSGYRLTKEAKWFSELNENDDYGKFDTLSVESFRTGSETDSEVIQSAFDNADGKVVSFDSGRLYKITETVVAQAGIVRGINGNNATLVVQSDITGLRYEGTLTGTANPSSSNNKELDLKESNAFIERLRVTSKNGYEGNGIEIERLLSANIEACHTFNLKNGIIVKGRNRNLIFSNCHVRDIFENGVFFENVDLHQLNMTGMHVGYCRNGITVIDGAIANWQMSACDIESSVSDAYGNSESLINIRTTESGRSDIWEINFSALTLQDHARNREPLINIDLKRGELANLVIGSSHISNSMQSHPLIYINGGTRIGLNNITMKNDNPLDNSIVLGNDNNGIIITNNHLPAPITYGNVNNLIISNNITTGFTLEEVDDGNILIANNL